MNGTNGAGDGALEEEIDLRASVQYAVMQIVKEEDDASTSTTTSMAAVNSLAELAFLYATRSLGPDLAAFSRHANKKTITEADSKLVARKNPGGILKKLEDFCDEHCATAAGNDPKRAKKTKRKRDKPINLQVASRSKPPPSSDGSSTEEEEYRLGLAEVQPARRALDASLLDSSDDDDDDGMGALNRSSNSKRRLSKVSPKKSDESKRRYTLDDTSSDEEDERGLASATAKPPPKATIRPQNKPRRLNPSLNDQAKKAPRDSDVDDSEGPSDKGHGDRLQEILDNLASSGDEDS